jgi:hypothetical protein
MSVSFGRTMQNSFLRGRPGRSRTQCRSARCRLGAPRAQSGGQSRPRGPRRCWSGQDARGLDRLGVSDRHEADAEGCVLVSPDDNLGLALGENFPAKRLGPEPGQAGQPRDLDGWRPPGPLRLQLFAAATPSRATPIRGPAPGCAPRPLPVCLQQIDTRPPVMPAGPLRGYRSICHMLPEPSSPFASTALPGQPTVQEAL